MATILELIADAHDADADDVNATVVDDWHNRELAGAVSLLLAAMADGKRADGVAATVADALGYQSNHWNPHTLVPVESHPAFAPYLPR